MHGAVMFEMIIELEPIDKKRRELLLTIRDLLVSTRSQAGCRACFACRDMENRDLIHMTIQWESRMHLADFQVSTLFCALSGAAELLCRRHRMVIKTVSTVRPTGTG